MLKQYIYRGCQRQFEESEAPTGAVELKPQEKKAEPDVKVYKPANKTRKTAKK